jgi:murein DD-endopeptidase MepM/ murein hydrolase activator NlpD
MFDKQTAAARSEKSRHAAKWSHISITEQGECECQLDQIDCSLSLVLDKGDCVGVENSSGTHCDLTATPDAMYRSETSREASFRFNKNKIASILLFSIAALLAVREYCSFNSIEDTPSDTYAETVIDTDNDNVFDESYQADVDTEGGNFSEIIFDIRQQVITKILQEQGAEINYHTASASNDFANTASDQELSDNAAKQNQCNRCVVEVKSGDTLSSILRSFRINARDIDAISKKLANAQNLRSLQIGQTVVVEVLSDESPQLMRLELKNKLGNNIIITKNKNTYNLLFEKRKTSTIVRGAKAVVRRNFIDSASIEGVPNGVVREVARVLHGAGLGDLRANDSFSLLYEENQDESTGRVIGERAIRYISVTIGGKIHELYNWGGKNVFYNEKGESAQASFLEIPFKNCKVRISSPFGFRRHPILGITRMHSGVDFAAKFGTEVCSAAPGVVVKAGRNGGYGLYVRVRHANGYETSYAHLSSIMVRTGDIVAQGAVVGRVGCSGLAKGAHLHHEVIYMKRFVDPQKHYNVTAVLAGRELGRFHQMQADVKRRIAGLTTARRT